MTKKELADLDFAQRRARAAKVAAAYDVAISADMANDRKAYEVAVNVARDLACHTYIGFGGGFVKSTWEFELEQARRRWYAANSG